MFGRVDIMHQLDDFVFVSPSTRPQGLHPLFFVLLSHRCSSRQSAQSRVVVVVVPCVKDVRPPSRRLSDPSGGFRTETDAELTVRSGALF